MKEDTGSSPVLASGTDEEPPASNQRRLTGRTALAFGAAAIVFSLFHLLSLNLYPIETWTFRSLHVAGALVLGFMLMAAWPFGREGAPATYAPLIRAALVLSGALGAAALGLVVLAFLARAVGADIGWLAAVWPSWGIALTVSVGIAIPIGWVSRPDPHRPEWVDWILAAAAVSVVGYFVFNLEQLRYRAGVLPLSSDMWSAIVGVALILELTRRVAGLALPIVAFVFILYSFVGPWLPGFLSHRGYAIDRFFSYIYTDNGILSDPVAVSSTYIILFIIFSAFLSASRVGDYFVNFAFAAAGRARGGPAKVAVFASGLMGMINGTSAGNVVATGSLTIPLMKKVGYRARTAAAIEAAASTGGQIMPPIMGAGAFIMAEVTGIPYPEIAVAAIIPAVLYFLAVFLMVDFEAAKLGMRGMHKKDLPVFSKMLAQAYLFIPIVILITALFMNYSVIRAGTLALVAAAVVSWLTPHRMGPAGILRALRLGAEMSIQIIAVCACAGIIVGVIALTGVGARFSSLLLGVAGSPFLPAGTGQILALFFAMMIAVILGMGMPTTAAYAVAASVVAPGLIQLGLEPLVAHFFVFYFAVISAITPPVALAAYAGAAIANSEPMQTSVTAFKLGLAAFIVPFMAVYSPSLFMEGEWGEIVHVAVTASVGIYLLAAAVQGWFLGPLNLPLRIASIVAALALIEGGLVTDLVGLGLGGAVFAWQMVQRTGRVA